MAFDLVHPPKARPGDRIAVLSPSFAPAGAYPEVHEQAVRRLTEVTGLILWANGIASFYGGSSQVHLGPGPAVDDIHARSLRAALLTGGRLEITDPGESEDVGIDWADPRALDSFGEREATDPWSWHGPDRSVTGRSWGGCLEVIEWILTAGRFPFPPEVLQGGVLIVETSEELVPARNVGWIVRSLGERGILGAVDAVLVARPPVSDSSRRPSARDLSRLRAEQRDAVVAVVGRYNPDAVVCVGIPFGHTRPQWILPHGGAITVDGVERRIFADYGGSKRNEVRSDRTETGR